ncbi:MAG: hypothetical protein PWQ63_30 [Methanolobus sp.]|nr:hypothetical protein [Methanolobus sp.]MDK2946870.1 hypothetical protein [Methanolobus sp.]
MNATINESYLKLKWNVKGIFDELPTIVKQLEYQKSILPEDHKKDRNKLNTWIGQLNAINKEIENIKTNKIPLLEKDIQYTFSDPDLVVLTFIQPSVKNLFTELDKYYERIELEYDFGPYLNLDQAAKVLALIGDAAISLALVQVFWQPNISNVGQLTNQRSNVASNENLARICDKWGLYESRIPNGRKKENTKKEKIDHTKGTIVEALFGVIYVEMGLDKIVSSVVVLK